MYKIPTVDEVSTKTTIEVYDLKRDYFEANFWVPIWKTQGITKEQQKHVLRYTEKVVICKCVESIIWFKYFGVDGELILQVDFKVGKLYLSYFKEHEINKDYLSKYIKIMNVIEDIMTEYEERLCFVLWQLKKYNSPYHDIVKKKCKYSTLRKINKFPYYNLYHLCDEKMITIIRLAIFPNNEEDKIHFIEV